MHVTPRYKQTLAGIIPNDWEVTTLGEAVDFLDGLRRPVKDSDRARMRGDIPYYGASGVVDYVDNYIFDEDLILLGEDGENILSRKCRLAFTISGKTWVNNHAHVLRPRPPFVLNYLADFLESRDYAQYNTGTAQPKLNKFVCSRIPVVQPPLPEQHAIAAALSDADGLLRCLDLLVAKKRDLKQASMQELLSGKKRLPGFGEGWVSRRLGDHVTILRNGTNSRAELDSQGRVRYLHYGDIHGCHEVTLTTDSLPFLPAAKASSLDRLQDGDLIFADASEDIVGVSKSVEIRGSKGAEIVAGLHTIAVRFDKQILADGFKGYLQHFGPFSNHLRRLAAGTKVLATNRAHIASAELLLPPLAEQTAIASVLSDMAAEIAALERRRNKMKLLKQAMMQELLTGRTRLV